MKTKLIILLFFITPLLFSQSENIDIEKIPDQLIGSWVIDQPGEGQIPSQIFRWKFKKTTSNKGECEFHWLFKRQEDPEYITVGVAVYDFYIIGNRIKGEITKAGSQQKQAMVMEFYDEIKWYLPGDEYYEKFGMKEINSEYEIKENVLILFEDNNKDGDYEEDGEVQKYLREEKDS